VLEWSGRCKAYDQRLLKRQHHGCCSTASRELRSTPSNDQTAARAPICRVRSDTTVPSSACLSAFNVYSTKSLSSRQTSRPQAVPISEHSLPSHQFSYSDSHRLLSFICNTCSFAILGSPVTAPRFLEKVETRLSSFFTTPAPILQSNIWRK